jgi:hypothetical protein
VGIRDREERDKRRVTSKELLVDGTYRRLDSKVPLRIEKDQEKWKGVAGRPMFPSMANNNPEYKLHLESWCPFSSPIFALPQDRQ